jgi:hypothetical protein
MQLILHYCVRISLAHAPVGRCYIYIYIYVYIYIYIYTFTHTYTCISTFIHVHRAQDNRIAFVCVYIYIYIYTLARYLLRPFLGHQFKRCPGCRCARTLLAIIVQGIIHHHFLIKPLGVPLQPRRPRSNVLVLLVSRAHGFIRLVPLCFAHFVPQKIRRNTHSH